MDSTVLAIETGDRQIVDITDGVRRFCAGRGDGLCSVFVPHATAGVAIMETGAGPSRTWSRCWSGCCRATTGTAMPTARPATSRPRAGR